MTYLLRHKKILALLLFFAAWWLYHHLHAVNSHHAVAIRQSVPVAVDVDQVKVGSMPVEVHAIGTLVAAKEVQITPEVSGQIANVMFQDGAFVKQGTPLIQLDDAVSRAQMASTQASLVYSQADYKRKVLLRKQGAISQGAVDQALADLQQKKAAAEQARVMVAKMNLVAPFDGVLGKSSVSTGDYVTVGQHLVTITDINHLRAEYAVPEKYFPQLKLGQAVAITTSTYPGREFIGHIAYISPTINAADRTISVYASLSNEHKLLTSGLFVNVTHQLEMKENVLMIPVASLVPTIDGQHVFKLVNDKVVSVPITLGHWVNNTVQVMSGLVVGDKVVVAGQQKLKDGTLVHVLTKEVNPA